MAIGRRLKPSKAPRNTGMVAMEHNKAVKAGCSLSPPCIRTRRSRRALRASMATVIVTTPRLSKGQRGESEAMSLRRALHTLLCPTSHAPSSSVGPASAGPTGAIVDCRLRIKIRKGGTVLRNVEEC